MRAPWPFRDAPAPDRPDRRYDARDEGVPQTRARLIGRWIAIGLCALACVVALSLHTQRVSAVNLSVTNCLDDGSAGSLRVVVGAAGSGDIIGFNQDCTGAGAITLGSTLTLTQNVTIDGVGHSVTVQAAATPNTATYGVFTINSGVVSISNLTIANGKSGTFGGGGGISNGGTLTVTNSTLSGNSSPFGGGIFNGTGATLTVTNSTLSGNNSVNTLGQGGGIYNNFNGTVNLTNSTLSNNSATSGAGGYGSGGGIYNFSAVTVTNSILSGNSAPGRPTFAFGGGGIYNDFNGGTMTVTNSILTGNSATDGLGGGIFNSGTLTVTNSALSGNSTLSGNSAPNGNGGGIYNDGTLTVTNSTLSGNSAPFGGGISNNSRLTVTNSTLSGNSAPNGTGGFSYGGGGINSFSGTLNLTKTIVAGNTAAGTGPDISGAVTTTDHNLIGTISGSTGITNGDAQGDIVNPTPNLDTLKDNGGTTPLPDGSHVTTQAITGTSPAFHAGDPNVCTVPFPTGANSQDERGPTFPRSTTACSIGAFEPQVAPPPPITLSPATLPNGTVGLTYSQAITATGGSGTGYSFALTAGSLPAGLTLNGATGVLAGMPTTAGSSTFTVTATDSALNSGSQQYTLTIGAATGPTLTSIALTGPNSTPPPATLKVGQRVQLTATGTYSDGSTANLTTQVQWSSTTATIATVDATGIVTGQSPGGPVTLTATLNGVSGTATVSVTPPTPLGIQPAPAPAARPAGRRVACRRVRRVRPPSPPLPRSRRGGEATTGWRSARSIE